MGGMGRKGKRKEGRDGEEKRDGEERRETIRK